MVNNLFILVYTMSATAMPQQGKIGEIEMEHRSQVTQDITWFKKDKGVRL